MKTKEIPFWAEECRRCRGTGRVKECQTEPNRADTCPDCRERGHIPIEKPLGLGTYIGLNDKHGNPVHVGDRMIFDSSVWHEGSDKTVGHEYTVEMVDGEIRVDGTPRDIPHHCAIIRKWNHREIEELRKKSRTNSTDGINCEKCKDSGQTIGGDGELQACQHCDANRRIAASIDSERRPVVDFTTRDGETFVIPNHTPRQPVYGRSPLETLFARWAAGGTITKLDVLAAYSLMTPKTEEPNDMTTDEQIRPGQVRKATTNRVMFIAVGIDEDGDLDCTEPIAIEEEAMQTANERGLLGCHTIRFSLPLEAMVAQADALRGKNSSISLQRMPEPEIDEEIDDDPDPSEDPARYAQPQRLPTGAGDSLGGWLSLLFIALMIFMLIMAISGQIDFDLDSLFDR